MRKVCTCAILGLGLLVGGLAIRAMAAQEPTDQPSTRPASQVTSHPEWATPISIEGLPNLHRVSPGLYRSAQPTKKGMQQLPALGIKTVISLRALHDDEEQLGNAADTRNFQIRMKTWHAEKEDAVLFLKLVSDPDNQPVLVHCQHGADRTGTMCALYRMAIQGWTKQQAVQEMTEGDFGFHPIWSNLTEWLNMVDVQELRKAAGMPEVAGTGK